MRQLNIFADPSTIDAAFWKFHEANPGVMEQLIRMTEQLMAAGQDKTSMKMLFEVIRWKRLVRTQHSDFLLNNNFTSRYTRILQEKRPDLAHMFDTRRIHS